MIFGEVTVWLLFVGLLLAFVGAAGWVLYRWGIELKQFLPRYEKRNRVEQGGSR